MDEREKRISQKEQRTIVLLGILPVRSRTVGDEEFTEIVVSGDVEWSVELTVRQIQRSAEGHQESADLEGLVSHRDVQRSLSSLVSGPRRGTVLQQKSHLCDVPIGAREEMAQALAILLLLRDVRIQTRFQESLPCSVDPLSELFPCRPFCAAELLCSVAFLETDIEKRMVLTSSC